MKVSSFFILFLRLINSERNIEEIYLILTREHMPINIRPHPKFFGMLFLHDFFFLWHAVWCSSSYPLFITFTSVFCRLNAVWHYLSLYGIHFQHFLSLLAVLLSKTVMYWLLTRWTNSLARDKNQIEIFVFKNAWET